MLRRLLRFLVRPIASPAVEKLYRTCVDQARQPAFYAELHAPDTVDGRFDLLILHVILLILRLKDHPRETQQLFDVLFADMDKNLRQMGVSDISIAKKMKPLLAAFYGRAKAYEPALAATDDSLHDALCRNIYGATLATENETRRLTAYVRYAHEKLAAQETATLLAGIVDFPVQI